jgi:hypothetical protein
MLPKTTYRPSMKRKATLPPRTSPPLKLLLKLTWQAKKPDMPLKGPTEPLANLLLLNSTLMSDLPLMMDLTLTEVLNKRMTADLDNLLQDN